MNQNKQFIPEVGGKRGVLWRTKIYLIGGIESAKDNGVGWRKYVKDELQDTGIIFLDPTDKPFVKDMSEIGEEANKALKLREEGKYDELETMMREIRRFDLSCCDRSDAVIFYYDKSVHSIGSVEEIAVSNSMKRAIFLVSKTGVKDIPLWFFGMFSNKYMYSSLDSCINTIRKINDGEIVIDNDRWRLLRPEFR